jgi:ribosomal protein S18 acetylase RimI-like enzyme
MSAAGFRGLLICGGAIGAVAFLSFPTDAFVAAALLLFLAFSRPAPHIKRPALPVTIRAATSTDANILAPMAVELAGMHGTQVETDVVEAAIASLLSEHGAPLKMVVAESSENRIIGYATYLDLRDLPYRTPYRRVTELFVSSECRGAGVGKALLARLRELCLLSGLDVMSVEVMPTNTVARRFYNHLGFRETQRVSFVEWINVSAPAAVNADRLSPTSVPQAQAEVDAT